MAAQISEAAMMQFRNLKFVAIDGEGISIEETGEHFYNLLCISSRSENRKLALTPDMDMERLRTGEIFYILSHLPRKGRIHVMFFFNYDITKWLEDLSIEDKIALWKNQKLAWIDPLLGYEYRITYYPHKFFKLEEYYDKRWHSITIYDAFGFFQTSFVNACLNWKIISQVDADYIQGMKNKRSKFTAEDINEVTNYCFDECDKLCQLMEKVRDALAEENIIIRSWFGAGAIGQALLYREEMQQYIAWDIADDTPEYLDFHNAIMSAYFGGRFELMRQGIIDETHQYDINSAYPYAMTTIPDLSDCDIYYAKEYVPDAEFALWFVTYDVRTTHGTPLFGPLPYRKHNGTVLYPYSNKYGIWVHAIELRAAIECYGARCFKIHAGYILSPKRPDSAFSWVEDIAKHRLFLKKLGDLRNIVLKLGLNSLYGKMAQGLGSENRIPPFQNYYLAGYVTAHCRANLLRIAWSCGNKGSDVIQFATDGIFSKSPSKTLGQNTSEKLGEWEYTYYGTPIIYIQPGVFFTSAQRKKDERKTKRRTRGFRADRLSASQVFQEWEEAGPFSEGLKADDSRFYGIGSCMVTKDWDRYGKWIVTDHTLSFDAPPAKTRINPIYFNKHRGQWGMGSNNFIGIPYEEISDTAPDYFVLVTEDNLVDRISAPFPEKKQRTDFESLQKTNTLVRQIERDRTIDYDQGDYERHEGFNAIDLRN